MPEARGRDGRLHAGPALARLAARLGLTTAIGLAAVLRPAPAAPQEIVQVRMAEPASAGVQVVVAGAEAMDQIECLVRDATGRVRVVSGRLVGSGTAAGDTDILLLPLPPLAPDEREMAVSLVRGDRELDRTPWRPVAGLP